jgi:hypothetical protein
MITRGIIQAAGGVALVAAVLSSGCVRTERARHAEPSGFLKDDYALMKKTVGDRAQLLYINPQADFKAYDKMLIEPVTIWRSPESDLADLPAEEAEELGRYLHAALAKQLGQTYAIVESPSEGTLRFRFGISEASKSTVALDIITSIAPPGIAINAAKRLSTGTHSFVGKAVAEGEIRDAETGELLAAGLAARVGGKTLLAGSNYSSWGDVKAAFDTVAEGIDKTLAGLRAGTLTIEYEK